MDRLLVICLRGPQVALVGVGGNDLASNKAVLTKAAHRFVVTTFEVQVTILDKPPVDQCGGKGVEIVDDRLATFHTPGRRGKAGHQHLRWLRIADCEFTSALDVATGLVSRRTNKTEKVLPAHRGDHVLGGQIERSVLIPRAHKYERRNGEKLLPDRNRRVELYDVAACCRRIHGITRNVQNPTVTLDLESGEANR